MRKVIVRLGNGLGNQLFTYAAAYSFARKNKAELHVDDESGFYKRHKYELNSFNISSPIVDKKNKFIGTYGRLKRKLLIKLSRFNTNTKFLIEQKDNNKLSFYKPEQFNIYFKNNLYFEGYFQSEKYFKHYINDIINEYSFKNDIINQKNSFVKYIKENNTVSIHLRQNKFINDEGHKNLKKLNSEFVQHNISLIKKGIEYFDKKIDNPKYLIWSNNFSNLKELFPSKKFILVDANLEKDPAYDLFLMSLCKHFILSPSTLHYWGAMLSKNKNKICLSPPNVKNKSGYYGFSNNKDIRPSWWSDF